MPNFPLNVTHSVSTALCAGSTLSSKFVGAAFPYCCKKRTFMQSAALGNLGSERPDARAATPMQHACRDRSSARRSKSLILCHVAQCTVVGKSRSEVHALGGETGVRAQPLIHFFATSACSTKIATRVRLTMLCGGRDSDATMQQFCLLDRPGDITDS